MDGEIAAKLLTVLLIKAGGELEEFTLKELFKETVIEHGSSEAALAALLPTVDKELIPWPN